MGRSFGKHLSIGVLASALLASGLLVGVSHGASRSEVVRLVNGEALAEANYPLRDEHGRRSAGMSLYRGELLDADGNQVGSHRCECVNGQAGGTGWWCTHILSLREGPYTDVGTIVITGLFRGFNGEQLAIVGGTGAYANAGGYATLTVQDQSFVTTLNLSP